MRQHENTAPRHNSSRGFSLIEFLASAVVLVIGIVPVVGLMINLSQQREQVTLRYRVLGETQALLEQVMSSDPAAMAANFDGNSYPVEGVMGLDETGDVMTVVVDTTDPALLNVSVIADWVVGTEAQSLTLRTQIYNESG